LTSKVTTNQNTIEINTIQIIKLLNTDTATDSQLTTSNITKHA